MRNDELDRELRLLGIESYEEVPTAEEMRAKIAHLILTREEALLKKLSFHLAIPYETLKQFAESKISE